MSREPVNTVVQHAPLRSVVLHLLPGALVLGFLVIIAPMIQALQYPFMVTLLLAIVFVAIPFELGYMLYLGKKATGQATLSGIVVLRNRIPAWQYAAIGLPALLWMILAFAVVFPPLDRLLIDRFFFWLPNWLLCDGKDLLQHPKSVLMPVAVLAFLLNGMAAPLVEELYFRGYLLPRMACFGRWAPAMNTALFSLYHFFSPWQNPARIVGLLPTVYAVWWKRNVLLGVMVHCGANSLFTLIGIWLAFS